MVGSVYFYFYFTFFKNLAEINFNTLDRLSLGFMNRDGPGQNKGDLGTKNEDTHVS